MGATREGLHHTEAIIEVLGLLSICPSIATIVSAPNTQLPGNAARCLALFRATRNAQVSGAPSGWIASLVLLGSTVK
jgi:hypothetical protein